MASLVFGLASRIFGSPSLIFGLMPELPDSPAPYSDSTRPGIRTALQAQFVFDIQQLGLRRPQSKRGLLWATPSYLPILCGCLVIVAGVALLARQLMMALRLFSEVFVLSQCSVRALVGTMAPKAGRPLVAKSSGGAKKVSETAALKAATLLAKRDKQALEKEKDCSQCLVGAEGPASTSRCPCGPAPPPPTPPPASHFQV